MIFNDDRYIGVNKKGKAYHPIITFTLMRLRAQQNVAPFENIK